MADAAAYANRLAPLLRASTATIRWHLGRIHELVSCSGHLDGDDAAIIGLSLAAMGADDPAEITATLCGCEMETPLAGWAITLRGAVSVVIQAHASAIHQQLVPPRNDGLRIWLCADPAHAWLTWDAEGASVVRYVRAQPPDETQNDPSPHDQRRGVTRITVLDSKILDVLAELAADTLARPSFTVV